MPFVTPKGASSTSNSTGRTTFRPPWVKDDGGAAALKPTTVPWAKKTADKENGETTGAAKKTAAKTTELSAAKKPIEPTKKTTEPAKKTATEAAKKPIEPTKKAVVEPAKKATEAAKKSGEPIKKSIEPATTKKVATTPLSKKLAEPVKKPAPALTRMAASKKKKEPTPPPSSSEEEEETEEEESEEETETESDDDAEEEEEEEESEEITDDEHSLLAPLQKVALSLKPTPKKSQPEESELTRRFSIEKPKLRPVVVKRDKSMKKIADDDDDQVDGETEEERERQLRFKLEKPKLRHVKREEKPLPNKSTDDILKIRPVLKKVPKVDEILKETKEEPKPEFKTKTLRKTPSIKRELSIKNVPAPPPLPSLVPKAPPPPPPPLGPGADKKDLTQAQKAALEKLKSRPRRRPDWSEMMKEVESGRKLRHVECNDRSQPILTCKSMTKVDNKFIYETEKDNSHNKLLKQIQGGVRLKPTKTNDRSKPILDGLRKFRKQMTIEEQLQKSQSKINMLAEAPAAAVAAAAGASVVDGPISRSGTSGALGALPTTLSVDLSSGDELDDIDKLRDDLQSTKQMLALELRNREAQERENKKLLAKVATLEAELESEKSREKNLEYGSNVIVATMDPIPTTEQFFVNSLKEEVENSRKTQKELEKKYLETGEQLDQAKTEIEEQKRQIQILERRLAQALQGCISPSNNIQRAPFDFCYMYDDPNELDNYYCDTGYASDIRHNGHKGGGSFDGSRRASNVLGDDSAAEFDAETESDPDEPEEKKAERREKKLVKEVKILRKKLTQLKVKQEAAKKEKDALKQAMKKNHVILKEENKKFKKLEKEVQKMAASMKDDDEEDEDNDEDKDEPEEEPEEEQQSEEESEEESEESESEESGAETASESEAEDATNTDKKANLEPRVKKHESRLSAMKKCNVLLQANVDNLQDEITQVRSKAANLQAELDSVLQDLGF